MKKSRAEKEIEEGSWQESIDNGIDICNEIISNNKVKANLFLIISILLLILVGGFVLEIITNSGKITKPSTTEFLDALRTLNSDSSKAYLGLFDESGARSLAISLLLLIITLFGIMMALYRLHINEASKYEHFKIGLIRIQIALVYSSDESLPISSLLENVFTYPNRNDKKKFDSIVPGAIASDSISLVLNKIDDLIESIRKKKTKK